MKSAKTTAISLMIATALYTLVSWPLPRQFHLGIPAHVHPDHTSVQPLLPGDHLQLMYHFWLAGDMLGGGTPAFYNLYEFNTGDDEARFMPGSYYFPFSLMHSGIAALGGQALGWNLTSFLSIWGTLLFTWLLTRRYTRREWLAAVAAAAATFLPFRWINLFGGSPAGFAMLWVPAIWLGVDLAVRRRSLMGGALAGLAVWMASWCDTHVFFFSVLALPAWTLIALVAEGGWRRPRQYPGIILALLPVAAGLGIALGSPLLFQWLTLRVTGAPPEARLLSQRTLGEVHLYSPPVQGLFDGNVGGLGEHVFIGLAAPLLILLGGLAWLARSPRRWHKDPWRLALWLLLCTTIVVTVLLALGVRGPGDGRLLVIARRLIPPYRMVRQTAKIFILVPSLLAVAMALAGDILSRRLPWRRCGALLALLLILLAAWEYKRQVHVVISHLQPEQGAYAAVAEDAAARGSAPRAVVLPLWPGDTHYTSLYQYFASIYRVRLVNGYRPFVRENYFTNVFERLVSLNQGWLTDEQIDHLAGMRIDYLMLHEDHFPEKVSPFPVTQTLRNLLEHPRLELLHQDQSVWAFRLLEHSSPKAPYAPHWNVYGSARQWDAARARQVNAQTVDDDQTAGGRALVLDAEEARLQIRPVWARPSPGLRWLVRARGCGVLAPELITFETTLPLPALDLNNPDWRWYEIPADIIDGYAPLSLKITLDAGTVHLDRILLTAGRWEPELPPGQSLSIPAPCFFHAGYIDPEQDAVVLERGHAPLDAVLFYGPKLPLPAGRYRVDLDCAGPATPGTLLAQFNIRQRGSDPINWNPVFAGYPATAEFTLPVNLPFHLELVYLGTTDLAIRSISFTRLE